MYGIHTALVTPFDYDDRVDIDAFAALCRRQVQAGVHGLVPCGTTGETPTLEQAESDDLVRVAVEVAGRRVKVTAGIGSNSTRVSVANAERVRRLGADLGLLVLPYYNKPNPDGLRAHVRAVASTELPLVLYHVPGRTAHHLPAPLLAELAEIDGVVAVKEATGDVRYGSDLILRTTRSVLSGDDFTFLGLLAQGGAGCISVVSNVDPVRTVAIYEHQHAGRHREAWAELARLWPLITWLFSEVNPVPAKQALAELGLCGARPRLPLAPFSGASCAGILADLGLQA